MKSDRRGKGGPPPPPTQVDLSGFDSLKALLRIRPFRRLWLVLGLSSMGDSLGPLASAVLASPPGTGPAAEGGAVRFLGAPPRVPPLCPRSPGRAVADRPGPPGTDGGS